jgi:putative transposase
LPSLPGARELLGDKGYDSDWFRKALAERGITPCIPPRANRKTQYAYDKTLYRQRHKIENVFGRLKSLPLRRQGTGDASQPDTTDAPTPS